MVFKNLEFIVGYRHPKSVYMMADGVFIAVKEKKGDAIATLTIYDGCRFVGRMYKPDFDKQIETLFDNGWKEMDRNDIYVCAFGMGLPGIPFWEDVNESLSMAFKQLMLKEEIGEKSVIIEGDGMFRYMFDAPVVKKTVKMDVYDEHCTHGTIPRHGDVLLNTIVRGQYKGVRMFQYDEMGSKKIMYYEKIYREEEICENMIDLIAPFADGIPLLQIGKMIYIELDGVVNTINDASVIATYALLESSSRKLIGQWCDDNGNGLKMRHIDGTIYQVMNLNDFGHSPNVLAPIIVT